MDDDSEPTDLLGHPYRDLPSKRGRRKLRFHAEVYEKVEVLAASGMTQAEICDAIGISDKTLTKYFRKELDNALSRQQAEANSLLAAAARKGSVAAIKAWKAELDKQAAARALRSRERTQVEARKGVKEIRQEAAQKVANSGGRFATTPAPQLIIDNS